MAHARTFLRRVPVAFAAFAAFAAALSGRARAQTPQESAGLDRLLQRVGEEALPTGAGVVVGQVEAPAGGAFLLDRADGEFRGKAIANKSRLSQGPSEHATQVAQRLFGLRSSLAPGISRVTFYEANHWLGAGLLGGAGATPPTHVDAKVFCNSWIGDAGAASNAYLRKLDFAIDRQDLIVCAGVNNGTGALDAPLLAQGFDTLAVGRSDGLHRAGPTSSSLDGPGRGRPEIVAPAEATSFATPLVAGAAALLVETARREPALAGNPRAERSELIKAVLLAGARHDAAWSNSPVLAGATRGATSTPLDARFGAGHLDVEAAHWILTGGEAPASRDPRLAATAPAAAWSTIEIASGQSLWLRFAVDAPSKEVSIVAAWHRQVAEDFGSYSLADLDLELWAAAPDGGPLSLLGTPAGMFFHSGNVLSDSAVDNVEHLHLLGLSAGEYLLEVRRAPEELPIARAAVAWRFEDSGPIAYGEGKPNAFGVTPTLAGVGRPSRRGGGFALEVAGAAADAPGVVVCGAGRGELPFAGGSLWVAPPYFRAATARTDGDGFARIPIDVPPAWPGDRLSFQFWFRDSTQPDGTGVGLTNALEVPFAR